jgi:hypothetical protein
MNVPNESGAELPVPGGALPEILSPPPAAGRPPQEQPPEEPSPQELLDDFPAIEGRDPTGPISAPS